MPRNSRLPRASSVLSIPSTPRQFTIVYRITSDLIRSNFGSSFVLSLSDEQGPEAHFFLMSLERIPLLWIPSLLEFEFLHPRIPKSTRRIPPNCGNSHFLCVSTCSFVSVRGKPRVKEGRSLYVDSINACLSFPEVCCSQWLMSITCEKIVWLQAHNLMLLWERKKPSSANCGGIYLCTSHPILA